MLSSMRTMRPPMNHDIPVDQLGPQGEIMAHAIDACVHCGFCLPACPTYALLGDEMDSPRGRIFLMKEVLEGELPLMDAAPHLDRCLGCMGCVTACPSGVPYGELITSFRGWSEPQRRRTAFDKAKRVAILKALPAPKLFSVAARIGQYAKPLSPLLPDALKSPLDLLPEHVPAMVDLPTLHARPGNKAGAGRLSGRLRPAGARAQLQCGHLAGALAQRRGGRDSGGLRAAAARRRCTPERVTKR